MSLKPKDLLAYLEKGNRTDEHLESVILLSSDPMDPANSLAHLNKTMGTVEAAGLQASSMIPWPSPPSILGNSMSMMGPQQANPFQRI